MSPVPYYVTTRLLHMQILLTGKWRLLQPKLFGETRTRVITLGNWLHEHENAGLHTIIGLPLVYGWDGADVFYDIVEHLLCNGAVSQFMLASSMPVMQHMAGVVYELALHIPHAVLDEDLHAFSLWLQRHEPRQLQARSAFVLEQAENNGFSNIEGSMQTLIYLARLTNASTCFMMPMPAAHTQRGVQPWAVAVNTSSLYAAFPELLPPSMLVLMHPRIAFEALGGTFLPLVPQQDKHNHDLAKKFSNEFAVIVEAMHCKRALPYRRWYSADEAEALRLRGWPAVFPKHTYLGMDDAEVSDMQAYFPSQADIGFMRTFRKYVFRADVPQHAQFAASWRSAFLPSEAVQAQVADIKAQISGVYTCIHVRIKQEYLDSQKGEVHGNKDTVLAAVRGKMLEQLARGSIYLASDTDVSEWLQTNFVPAQLERIASTYQVGLSGQGVIHGIVDNLVCSQATWFFGSIYSSYTLSICAKRGDQLCLDLYGRTLGDDRFLF